MRSSQGTPNLHIPLRALGSLALAFAIVGMSGVALGQEKAAIDMEEWVRLMEAQEFQKALGLVEPAANQGNLDAKSLMGTTLYQAGRYRKAIGTFAELIEKRYENPPDHTVGWYWVRTAWCHQALGSYREAAAAFDRALTEPDVSGHLKRAKAGQRQVHAAIDSVPRLAFVEAFGGTVEDREEALGICGLGTGDLAVPQALQTVLRRLRESNRFRYVDLFHWNEASDTVGVLIDLVGLSESEPPPYASPPKGGTRTPEEVLAASRRYSLLFQQTMSAPTSENYDRLRALEAELGEVAGRNVDAILKVLTESGDAEQVKAAAYVAGYLSSQKRVPEVVGALSRRFDDSSAAVRNAALRSVGLLEEKHGPRIGPLVDLDAALRAFSRPGVLDRQKAGEILRSLAKHPDLRDKIREAALSRARSIAGTRLSMHRRGGLALLREIEGKKRMTDEKWLRWLRENHPQSVGWWKWAEAEREKGEGAKKGR